MTVKGIDVSQWQGNIDFNKVKPQAKNFSESLAKALQNLQNSDIISLR